jgi:hypothetical protein
MALGLVSVVPAILVRHAVNASPPRAEIYHEAWPNEPELMQFLSGHVSSGLGQPLLGSVTFADSSHGATTANVWAHGMHTINEYSQLVSPQALYFLYAVLKQHRVLGALNSFVPLPGPSVSTFAGALQLFGTRYYLSPYGRIDFAERLNYPLQTLPRRPHGKEPGLWHVYELPHPNVGDYSPTEVVIARSTAEAVAELSAGEFDFTRKVVLSAPLEHGLVQARDMRLWRIRGGFHVSGRSDGTSLVVLPIQFSRCLRARDPRVRFVRADFMMAGMIFSGDLDTDVVFDYGMFSPGCRRADLADIKRFDLRIDLRMPHLTGDRRFPDWDGAVAKIRTSAVALQLWSERVAASPGPMPVQPRPIQPMPVHPGQPLTRETGLAELPKVTTRGVALIGIQGLNATVMDEAPRVPGQPVLRLVATPSQGRHYIAARVTGLGKPGVYRVGAWVRTPPRGVSVEFELGDGAVPGPGKAANHGAVIFDPTARTVASGSIDANKRGIEAKAGDWHRLWIDFRTDDQIVLALGVTAPEGSSFKGDGRIGVIFGGIDVTARP